MTDEQKARIGELLAAGEKAVNVAAEMGLKPHQVYDYKKRQKAAGLWVEPEKKPPETAPEKEPERLQKTIPEKVASMDIETKKHAPAGTAEYRQAAGRKKGTGGG